MDPKDILSSCSDSKEQEMQRMQKQAKILKENSINKFNALKTTTQRLEWQTFTNCPLFQQAFSSLFSNDEKDSKFDLSVIKVQFDKFLHSEESKPSNYDGRHIRENFKDYTQMEPQTFKKILIQNMDSIEQCIVKRARHEQEIQNRLKRLNERKLQIQECKIQKVKASDASLGDTYISGIVSHKGNDQNLENQSSTSRNESSRSRNECNKRSTFGDDTDIKPSYDTKPMAEVPYTAEYNVFAIEIKHSEQPKNMNGTSLMKKVNNNTTPNSSDMYNNDFKDIQNADDHEDERVMLANLIANLKLDIDENKKECKSSLKDSNDTWDRCIIALHDKEIELAKYKRFNDSPKRSISNGKPSFANPTYFKKAQSEKPCLYKTLYDKNDLANIFAPDRKEILTLEQKSRSKLNKYKVKSYDYTKQNSLYEVFKPPTQKDLDQLWYTNET
ncbi:hypothetical protein Tco_0868717 [Tanacetum coccineum]|uniref:Uncharacterized protein n=1 Tax=Tanacetum coccineum TaxID=301880 RepID=A0ABQ5HY67_9ASTR